MQELVNLLLTGKSVSNVFDKTIALDSGGSSKVGIFLVCSCENVLQLNALAAFEGLRTCCERRNKQIKSQISTFLSIL